LIEIAGCQRGGDGLRVLGQAAAAQRQIEQTYVHGPVRLWVDAAQPRRECDPGQHGQRPRQHAGEAPARGAVAAWEGAAGALAPARPAPEADQRVIAAHLAEGAVREQAGAHLEGEEEREGKQH